MAVVISRAPRTSRRWVLLAVFAAVLVAVLVAVLWPGGCAEDGGREGGGGQADRDVDQEHRAPAGELHEHAAQNLAGDEAHGGDRTVQTDGACAFGAFGEAGGDEGQRGGGHDRGTRALDDPGRDQQRGVLGQAAGQAGQRERDEPDHEHPRAGRAGRRPGRPG